MPTLLTSMASLPRLALITTCAATALTLMGCAETREAGYYNPAPASTTRDAVQVAEGGASRHTVQAPSQVQIKFDRAQTQTSSTVVTSPLTDGLTTQGQEALDQSVEQDLATPQNTLIPQAETFFGTLPCFHRDMRCTAQQVTLTLAPNGQWRARVAYLQDDQQTSGQTEATQGCWRGLAMKPPSITLLDANKNVRAQLRMTSAEVLRLQSIDGQMPNLTYTLNRQPDLDPINELDGVLAPSCD